MWAGSFALVAVAPLISGEAPFAGALVWAAFFGRLSVKFARR